MRSRTLGLLILCVGIIACANQQTDNIKPAQPSNSNEELTTSTACPEQRPQACTFDYRPVCAAVDTGVRCVKAPCPSTTQKTYGNACSACADEKVIGYTPGECPSQNANN